MFEQKITGIVLKKQALGEADELVTIYSKEMGKVRLKVQSSKRMTSKLSFALNPGSIGAFRIVGKSPFYKAAGAESIQSSKYIYTDLSRSQAFFILSELVSVSTPDEHEDIRAFAFLERAIIGLEDYTNDTMDLWLCKFAWGWSALLGFDISDSHPQARELFTNIDTKPDQAIKLRRILMDHLSTQLERPFKSLLFLNN